jgi:hypothetical protein
LSSEFPRQNTTEFFPVSLSSADAFDGELQQAPFSVEFSKTAPKAFRAMNSFDLKDGLLFDHSQLLLLKKALVNASPVLGKPAIS